MFGSSFKFEDPARPLSVGDYEVTLQKPYETTVSGYKVLKFPFVVDGVKELVSPNEFVLFDTNPEDGEDKMKMFIRRASKIKACFILKGSFNETNYVSWAGHKGRIHIDKDKAGFLWVSDFYQNENLTPADKLQL